MNKRWLAAILLGWTAMSAEAYESIYRRTPVGVVEVKEIPPRVALSASGEGDYFERDDGLFMQLFRYIDARSLAMTVPVEAEVKPATMRFFVGTAQQSAAVTNDAGVSVETHPARTVVSIGLRGGYNRATYERGVQRLEAWLAASSNDWKKAGEPYAVYWNGPFVPSFLKRSEVHIPLERAP